MTRNEYALLSTPTIIELRRYMRYENIDKIARKTNISKIQLHKIKNGKIIDTDVNIIHVLVRYFNL